MPAPIGGGTRARALGNHLNGRMPPTTRASLWETKPVCEGVEAYNKRSLHLKYRISGSTPSTQIPIGNTTPPEDTSKLKRKREQISLILQKNAVSEVPPDTPGFYSNVFLVRKASQGWRPIIDLKRLNAHLNAPHFRMFTISSVLNTAKTGDYAFKIDLDTFRLSIHPDSRIYLRFGYKFLGI